MSSQSEPEVTAFLKARYGKNTRANWRSSWKTPALLFALIGGAWLVWSGAHASTPEIRSSLISFSSTAPTSIQIRYSLQFRHPNVAHRCTLVARDNDKNTVGEIVDLIPSGKAKLTREVRIATRLQAVNAAIISCSSL